jgi:hypothetical protein
VKNSSGLAGGGASSQVIDCGNGYVEYTAVGTGSRAAGLSNGSVNVTLEDIDFSIWALDTTAFVREHGVWQAETSYSAGDIFRVEILNGEVLYKKNGVTFHTNGDPDIAYPLFVDSFLDTSGAIVGSAMFFAVPEECSGGGEAEDVLWTDLVHASATGSSLIKDASAGTGGGVSSQMINCGNGYTEYTAVGTGGWGAGLSHGSSSVSLEEIDFAIGAWDATASVRENGVWGAETGVSPGDVFRVEIVNGAVLYKKNGVTFHANSGPAITYPLLVDAFLDGDGATIGEATIFADSGECSASTWPNEPPGMTLLTDWGMNQDLATSGDAAISESRGWRVVANAEPGSADGWAERISDPGAPFSPSGVYDFVYPTGMVEGTAPGTVYAAFDSADEVYVGFWWKPSNPLDPGPNGMKLAFLFNGGGDLGGQQFLMLRPDGIIHALTEYPGDVKWRSPNVNATTVRLGEWHLIEWYANRLTGGLKWWLDGVMQGSHSDAPNAVPFDMFYLSPTWGGNSGAVKQSTDHYWYDHMHISTRPVIASPR